MILRRLGGRGGDKVVGEKVLSLDSRGEELFATETPPGIEILGLAPGDVCSPFNEPLFSANPFD
jgi:hypothetical protein